MQKLSIDVWSDIACPWCYVGKRRLEAALARFSHRDEVELRWRSFELDPSAPRERPSSDGAYAERLAKKYGTTVVQAQAMIDRMTGVAAAEGLDFHFERVRGGNTFDAHRVLHMAADRGCQDAVKERFFRAYFVEGEPIGDADALARLAGEAGLDAEEVRAALAGDAYAREARHDEAEARTLGITGVPFFVLGGKYAVSGAQPVELMLRGLEQAWADRGATEGEGAVCGPDGCT